MQKCNICFDEIKTNEFTVESQYDCVDNEDSTCMRLQCGHAYHTNCIINSFRRNEKCPMCRKDLINKNTSEHIHVFDLDDDSEPGEEDLGWILLDTLTKQERCKNSTLKDKRKELNEKIKDFHAYHLKLKQKRRQKIKEVLKEFRDEHHKIFRFKVKTVQRQLNIVKKIEKNAVEKIIPRMETPVENRILREFFKFNANYDASSILCKNDLNVNGFSRKFWT